MSCATRRGSQVTLVGVFIFFSQGSVMQLISGVLVCVLCIILYNNLKPYQAWQNDVLQQFAQLNVFITLLVAIVHRLNINEDPIGLVDADRVMGLILSVLVCFSAVVAFPLALLEQVDDPRLLALRTQDSMRRSRRDLRERLARMRGKPSQRLSQAAIKMMMTKRQRNLQRNSHTHPARYPCKFENPSCRGGRKDNG